MKSVIFPEDWLIGAPLAFYQAVEGRVGLLQRLSDDEGTRHRDIAGRLARLRRAINDEPGADPDVWQDTIGFLPEGLWGRSEAPSSWEHASHTALTIFALHTQGRRTAVHTKCTSLGTAVRRFAGVRSGDTANPDSAVIKRFQALAVSTPGAAMRYHLRSMVTLLRTEGTQLDYGLLAVDIHDLADPRFADRVRLRWGRDFYRIAEDQKLSDIDLNTSESERS